MRNRVGLLVFALSVLLLLAVEGFFLWKKVPAMDPDQYGRYAHDLETRNEWRYGYIQGVHGAYLVRARDAAQPQRSATGSDKDEMRSFMRSELRRIPRKTALETALYASILAFLFFGARPLRGLVRGRTPRRLRRLVADVLPGAVVFALIAFPLLVFGYGYGGFTNLVGPGAMSYSGPYFRWESWVGNSSNSISYRALVSVVTIPAGLLVELVWMALERIPFVVELDDVETAAPYWIADLLFYGALSVAAIRTIGAIRRRRRPVRAEAALPSI